MRNLCSVSTTKQPASDSSEQATDDYLLLGEIDFQHPLFVPFDDPLS